MSNWLQGFVSNWIAAEQLERLEEISEQNRKKHGYAQMQFDYNDPMFLEVDRKITDEFWASYPELIRKEGGLQEYFPKKDRAMDIVFDLAEEGQLSVLEYLALKAEIMAPRVMPPSGEAPASEEKIS